MKRRAGFTLVELLVAIGIIGLLVSILLPVMAKVRGKAQSTRCLSNLRQIAQVAHVHASSHRGRLPVNSILLNIPEEEIKEDSLPPPFFVSLLRSMTANRGPTQPSKWYSEVEKEYKEALVFRCPADDTDFVKDGNEGVLSRYLISFNATEYMHRNSEWIIGVSYALNGGLVDMSHEQQFQGRWLGGNTAKVKNSSTMLLAGDCYVSEWMHGCWSPELYSPDTRMTLADVYFGTKNVPESYRLIKSFDTKRHSGYGNFVFADGHAESVPLTPKTLVKIDLIQGR